MAELDGLPVKVATILPSNQGLARLDGRDILVLSPSPTAPQNAGNRKRIHRVCSDLKRRGARIHFVYYAFEWSDTYVPQLHHQAMVQQWDSFHLVPVTRPLQAAPAGRHHTIDEWWDAAGIEPMLNWLFQRGSYDAFIVNYAYLSRALELAPPHTLKILDTHDRFSDRLELLQSMGLPPEYFYTSPDEERRALDRADLVWAIKDEEAEFFRTLTSKPVQTMPHCDPVLLQPLRLQGLDADQELVLGMVGARNSINNRNAELFIHEVLPILRRHLAPVKIRFGGGMCDALAEWPELPSGVELAGRFDRPQDFYGTVDAVVVPLARSTGLKIKAVEAFSLGLPVIAHRHAVEGIPTDHPFHACATPQQIAECCLELAFDRSRLPELQQASIETYGRLSDIANAAMEATVQRIVQRPVIVIAVAPEMVLADTVYGQHVREAIDFLRYLCDVVLYADRPLSEGLSTWTRTFSWRASWLKMVLSPQAAEAMGIGDDWRSSAPFPLFHSIESFSDLMARLPRAQVWLLDLPQQLQTLTLEPVLLGAGFMRLDTLRSLARWPHTTLAAVLKALPGLVAVVQAGPRSDPVVAEVPSTQILTVPYWKTALAWTEPGFTRDGPVWIATVPQTLPWSLALQKALALIWPDRPLPLLLWAMDADVTLAASPEGSLRESRDMHALDRALRSRQLPACVIDAAGWQPAHSVLRETTQRARVPWVAATRLDGFSLLTGGRADAGEPLSLGDFLDQVRSALSGDPACVSNATEAYLNDAGWQAVWKRASARVALY